MDNAPSARDRQDAVVVVAMPRERFDNLVRALATLDERFNGTLTYRLARFLHSSDLFTAAFPLQQGIIYCHHAHGQFIRSALDKGKELSEKAVDLFEGLIKGEAVNGGAPMEVLKVLSDRAYSLRFMARAEKNNLPDPRIKEEPLPEVHKLVLCSLTHTSLLLTPPIPAGLLLPGLLPGCRRLGPGQARQRRIRLGRLG